MKSKGQAALEFLMTYGWAIMLVIVVVGALYATGMLKPCRWVGLQAKEFPLSEVRVVPIRLTTNDLVFEVYYQQAGDATYSKTLISKIVVDGTSVSEATKQNITITNSTATFNSTTPVTITVSLPKLSGGECADFDVTIEYRKPGATVDS
ncbi:MAG: hypothetical protein QXL97_02065, partial [Candidatus Aenigmatarchaeota archaeon]